MSKELDNMKFEDAMARCDEILRQLETGNLQLEESIERFKEGMRLIEFCKAKLTGYEADIANVVITESGARDDNQ